MGEPKLKTKKDYDRAQRRLAELRARPHWTSLDQQELVELSAAVREYDDTETMNSGLSRESEHA